MQVRKLHPLGAGACWVLLPGLVNCRNNPGTQQAPQAAPRSLIRGNSPPNSVGRSQRLVPRLTVGCSRASKATAPWSPGTALPWKGPCNRAASTARGHMNQHVSAGHVAVICGHPGRAAGSQLTLTHRLRTRRLVRCHAAQVAATCSGHSRCGMQGPHPCTETCGSPPAWLPATVQEQAQGAGATPERQLPLSTLMPCGR